MESHTQLTDEQILKAIKVIRKLDSEQDKKSLVDTRKLRLSFSLFKLPKASTKNSKLIKIVLPYVSHQDDVCLFVGDNANKGDRVKIDDTIKEHEEKLRVMGFSQITEVIPLLKLKLEYQAYESKRALSSRFDSFLADDKIMRFLPSLLGSTFLGEKRFPIQVRMDAKHVEKDLEKGLRTTICAVSHKGSSNSVVVAQLDMEDEQIVANVRAAVIKIMDSVTGGKGNLERFYLNLNPFPALPLLVSLVDRSTVPVPTLSLPPADEDEMEEVSTIRGKVSVSRDGTVTILKGDGHIKQIRAGKGDNSVRKRKLAQAKKERKEKAEADQPQKKRKKTKAAVHDEDSVNVTVPKAPNSTKSKKVESAMKEVTEEASPDQKSVASTKKMSKAAAEGSKTSSKTDDNSNVKKTPQVNTGKMSSTVVKTPSIEQSSSETPVNKAIASSVKTPKSAKTLKPKSVENVMEAAVSDIKPTPGKKSTTANATPKSKATASSDKTPKSVKALKRKSVENVMEAEVSDVKPTPGKKSTTANATPKNTKPMKSKTPAKQAPSKTASQEAKPVAEIPAKSPVAPKTPTRTPPALRTRSKMSTTKKANPAPAAATKTSKTGDKSTPKTAVTRKLGLKN